MKPPYFWSAGLDPESRESASLTRFLLTPLAALYTYLSARRIHKARPETVESPVVCMGNITSGGSGKTPVVQATRALLEANGYQTASLSRGYGGRLKGPLPVACDTHTARDVGDEPLMLAQTGKAWISADRVAGAKAMIGAGIDVIIMDDGHQNPSLYKDFSCLVLDASAPFGNGHVLPKGPLREPIATSLERAQAIILMGDGPVPPVIKASGLPVFRARLQRQDPLPKGPIFAFAGIGAPARFFDALRQDGADLKDAMSFADHHVYRSGELERLGKLADIHGAQLVTTEKDYMRLDETSRNGIVPICVRAAFEDEAAFMACLLSHIQRPAT